MSDGTAMPAVKAAIEARLKDALAIPVFRGKPEPAPAEYAAIWEGKAKREYSGLRGNAATAPMDEYIEVKIVCDVLAASGEDFAPAETQAYEHFKAAEAALRADLTLGGAWLFDRISTVEDNFWRTDKQRGCRVFATVSGKAKI